MSSKDRGAWESRGGRIRIDAKGRAVYIIRKQVDGKRFEVSTRKHTLAAALSEWDRFERDPDGYGPAGTLGKAPIYLDRKLAEEFIEWSLNEKGNSPNWVRKQRNALAWWSGKLHGVNLRAGPGTRRASLTENIDPALATAGDRATPIRVLKALYGWLRRERHELAAGEDPTFGTLRAPQAKVAQRTKSKVIPREHYLLVLELLRAAELERREVRERRRKAKVVKLRKDEPVGGPWADALVVQAGTGWHTTELVRFASAGTVEPLPPSMTVQHGAVAVLVCPLHKSGDTHRTAVSAEVLEAAKRLRKHGSFSLEWYGREVRAACLAVERPDGGKGIPVFSPGQFRHSVATWAFWAGADPAAVSAFLGHKNLATTKRLYATLATVPKVPTLA